MDADELVRENARLTQENARLRAALDEAQARLAEPEDLVRAIRRGEIDALVMQGEGREEVPIDTRGGSRQGVHDERSIAALERGRTLATSSASLNGRL